MDVVLITLGVLISKNSVVVNLQLRVCHSLHTLQTIRNYIYRNATQRGIKMKDAIGVIILGVLFAAMFVYGSAEAQTYQVTSPQGYSQGTVQINGNTAQFVNPMGYTTQTATIYPNQVVITTPSGYTQSVVGNSGYTVPPSPPTPSSPRVLQ